MNFCFLILLGAVPDLHRSSIAVLLGHQNMDFYYLDPVRSSGHALKPGRTVDITVIIVQ